MVDAKELRYLLGIIMPDDAISQEKLDDACDHAMTRIDEVLALADKVADGVLGFHAKREERAYFAVKKLRSIRKEWLIAHDGYRHIMAMG